jgi:hypothetical protein
MSASAGKVASRKLSSRHQMWTVRGLLWCWYTIQVDWRHGCSSNIVVPATEAAVTTDTAHRASTRKNTPQRQRAFFILALQSDLPPTPTQRSKIAG